MHIRELFDLTGKVAIVTGGSRGLGKEIATGLGEAGAKVAITARREQELMSTKQELESMGIECLPIVADVSEVGDVKSTLAQTLERWGKVDILVNNAGVVWAAPPDEMPLDKWDYVMNINARGTFICCQEIGKEMIKQKSGNIINISSAVGVTGVDPNSGQFIGYQASKAAVIIMTKQLAVEWAVHNIRVNCAAPSFLATRLTNALIERAGENMVRWIPMGRVGRPDEIKGTAVFLASEASSYITGQVICIDGGTTAW
ncbi:MAG: glucose 1-dehydrogenase [Dehalococcoidia bacterium]|nr:MAG: glucose 1-dehydrogenase [Dehalococcoidia bacterium]